MSNETKSSKELGKLGEKLAIQHLEKNGYEILEKNFRSGRGEIDIIVQKHNVIAFVEVKTKKFGDFGDPRTWVKRSKQRQIGRIAQAYLVQKGTGDFDYRFDVITVTYDKGTWAVDHIENAFWL